MRIGELAKRAGLATSKVRFYETTKLLMRAPRDGSGYRIYTERDLKIIAFIERAQRLGFRLKDIREFLATATQMRPSSNVLVGHLERKLQEVDAHLAEVRKRRREIVTLITELRAR